MSEKRNFKESEYIVLLILAYFREKAGDYSLCDLSDKIGLSISELSFFLEDMINANLLQYNDINLLTITEQGLKIVNASRLRYYSFNTRIADLYETEEKIGIDDIYVAKGFSKRKWRGSNLNI